MGRKWLSVGQVVDPAGDGAADRKLPPAAPAQWHERGLYRILGASEKIQIQNSKYVFYWMCTAFAPS